MIEELSASDRAGGSPEGRMPLLELGVDFDSFLTEEERSLVEQISAPVVQVPKGVLHLPELLGRRGAFGAVLLEGLVLHELGVGGQPGFRIIGRDDVIVLPDGAAPSLVASSRYMAQSTIRLALLGGDFLAAARRVPRMTVGLQAATAGQAERLFAQLVICQLPRVADRVLAMLWLLADSFGRVTAAGTRLPLSLTHEVLGALVGARRPTVTLALGELARRGAAVHQDGGWLLLEPPPAADVEERSRLEDVQLIDDTQSEWLARSEPAWDTAQTLAVLSESVSRLREEHATTVEQVRDRLRRLTSSRERTLQLRARIRARRDLSRRHPPSS